MSQSNSTTKGGISSKLLIKKKLSIKLMLFGTGLLATIGSGYLSAGTYGTSIAFATLGSNLFVYVTNVNSNNISMYSTTSGLLTSLGTTSPVASSKPISIVVDPSNQWAYVAQKGTNTIAQYADQTTGVLTLLNSAFATTDTQPIHILLK